MTQTWLQEAKAGDLVTTSRHQVGDHGRLGEILEVLGAPGHEHLRVRWEDERETDLLPRARRGNPPRGAPALTIVWFIVWFVSDLIGDSEPLRFDPVNIWAGTLILAAALDLNRSVATSRRSK